MIVSAVGGSLRALDRPGIQLTRQANTRGWFSYASFFLDSVLQMG
jgi:uncharacterized lipoprotein NlpE involved in copper resistance